MSHLPPCPINRFAVHHQVLLPFISPVAIFVFTLVLCSAIAFRVILIYVFRACLYLNLLSGTLMALYCLQILIFSSAMSHASLYHSGFPREDLTVRLGKWFAIAFLIDSVNLVQKLSKFAFWYNHAMRVPSPGRYIGW